MIRLPVCEEDITAADEEVAEYDRFGKKIIVYPRHEVWVIDCITGNPMRIEEAVIYRRDANGNFYYLRKDNTEPVDELGDLYPSVWNE